MRIRRITAGAFASILFATAAPAAVVPDHLKCYQIKDPVKLSGTLDLTTPQFGLEPGCIVGAAKYFCAPASKSNVAVTDRATGLPITPLPVTGPDPGDRICYKVKCHVPPPPFPPDQNVTDQFGNRTLMRFKAAFMCTPAVTGGVPPRFVDNGDGTVTDNQTGLQWEKKDTAVGSGVDLTNPHDVDNFYRWGNLDGCPFTGCPNGAAFTDFLGRLNNCMSSDGIVVDNAGFAGHCDWRLPTIQELQTIIDLGAAGCGSGSPCIDPIFGPTAASLYWSATTHAYNMNGAWIVGFRDGDRGGDSKANPTFVRAVRAGS